MTRHPLVPYALAFVTGSAFGLRLDHLPVPAAVPFLLFLFFLLASLALRRKAPFPALRLLPVLAVLFLAVGLAFLRDAPTDSARDELFSLAGEGERRVYLSGEICALRPPSPASYGELKYRFRLKSPTLREGTNRPWSAPLPDSIAVVWYGRPPSEGGLVPCRGARWTLRGKVCRRRHAGPGDREISSLFVVSRASSTHAAARQGRTGVLEAIREGAAKALSQGLDSFPEERSLILAMTLGLRSELPGRLTKSFRQAGTIHIFAISGLHVVVVAGILALALGLLGIPRDRWVLALAPCVACYVFLTGAPPSAMRAGLMVILYYLGPFLGRRPDPLNTLAATVIVLLLVSPLQLRDIGFVLSFSMVLGLILCAGPFVQVVKRLLRVERLQEEAALAESGASLGERPSFSSAWGWRAMRWAASFVSGLADTLGVSIAAALISLPLTAFYFDMLVPFSLLANVVVVPLSGLVMLSASAGLLVACLFRPLAVPFNLVAASGAWLMKSVSRWVASLPGASMEIVFPLWALCAWYGTLAVLLWILRRNQKSNGKNSDKNPQKDPDSLTSEI